MNNVAINDSYRDPYRQYKEWGVQKLAYPKHDFDKEASKATS